MGLGWFHGSRGAGRDHRLGPRERPSAVSAGAVVDNVTVDSARDVPRVVRAARMTMYWPRNRLRRIILGLAPEVELLLDSLLVADLRRNRERRSRPFSTGASIRALGVQPEPLVEERDPYPIFHDLPTGPYFPRHGPRQRGKQRARAHYPHLSIGLLVAAQGSPIRGAVYTPAPAGRRVRPLGGRRRRSPGRMSAHRRAPATASPHHTWRAGGAHPVEASGPSALSRSRA